MERRLNFEGMISHLFLKAKQPNDQTEKVLCPRFIKPVKKMNSLALETYYDRSHSFNKNTIIFMVFFTYKYVETKRLKIISTLRTHIGKHFIVLSGAEKTVKLELFVTEYGELLMFFQIVLYN